MPQTVRPMLSLMAEEPFDKPGWIFEIKWDGYRAIAYCNATEVKIKSRSGQDFTEKYRQVTQALQQLQINAVLDGEIVAVNENGASDFHLLQNWQNSPTQLQYFVFDILWLNGFDLTPLPLIERKAILKQLLPGKDDIVKYNDHITENGKRFFELAVAQGLEGIMAKKIQGTYSQNARTGDWLKIKAHKTQEAVIAGFTKPRNSRQFFGALLLGIYENKTLVYIGHTGGGFTEESLKQVYKKLEPLITKRCPFNKEPKTNTPATWVQPKLVCEIKLSDWTKDRIARHPIFMSLRPDKKPEEAQIEKIVAMETKKAATNNKASTKKNAMPVSSAKKNIPASQTLIVDPKADTDQFITFKQHELRLTNLKKPYWKKEGFTKGDLINYYGQVMPYLFPYMKDRPQSLNRYPNGIDGLSFYQKDMQGKIPDWMKTHKDYSESTQTTIEYLVCSNEADIIYMANLGCIEMHPWHSRFKTWDKPDWCLIDLDPDDKNTFNQVMDTALVTKDVLDAIGAPSCVKTSGASGIHIYIPLGARYNYDQSRQLAQLIVTLVKQELPAITSIERSPAKRKGMIYLDYLQNREGQTAAAPYSLRPKAGMPVSTPLDWSELKKGLTTQTYTAKNIFDRLKIEGDLFKPALGKGINMEKILGKLESFIRKADN